MGHAIVLNSASKANTTGGTFADNLSANSGDSLTVANFPSGSARILEMWGIDSDSVAELQVIYTRPDSSHDQQHGIRFEIPSVALGGAATNAAFNMLPGYGQIPLSPSDTPTFGVTSTAADDVLVSWITEYDNLPGVQGNFATWQQVQNLHKSTFGFFVGPTASGTPGAYGTNRALNADDDRFHAGSWYAILGITVQTQVTTVGFIGPDWGGQRIGCPAGSLDLRSSTWFVDQAVKWNKAMIPCFQANNKANTFMMVADGEASTQPKVDVFCYELTGAPF